MNTHSTKIGEIEVAKVKSIAFVFIFLFVFILLFISWMFPDLPKKNAISVTSIFSGILSYPVNFLFSRLFSK